MTVEDYLNKSRNINRELRNLLDERQAMLATTFEEAHRMVKELYDIEPSEDECEAILFARAFAKEKIS